MKRYTIENLLRVDKCILEFAKESEEFIREFRINEISLETLKTIFVSEPNDDELYLSYGINELQAETINKNLNTQIEFDFGKFEYYFQQYGEYKEIEKASL
ncbi:MAG: hypothetical protein IPK88_09555 [Saprospiraceae bacterium]|nr:hypothetical protein [Candidatus Defluviibacterium haderslevense]